MLKTIVFTAIAILAAATAWYCGPRRAGVPPNLPPGAPMALAATASKERTVPDKADRDALRREAKEKLTPEQYNICFLKGTEPPGSGKYNHFFEPGTYHCAVCGAELFDSTTKYDSHSGWPAFWEAKDKRNIELVTDNSLGMRRTEVRCAKCGAHLGHVFDDGPPPTGQRYCINSLALEFVPSEKK